MKVARYIESSCIRQAVFCASVALAAVMGCSRPAKNTLHVQSFTPGATVDVVGTLNGLTYELSVDRSNAPLYVAHYEPIGVQDVGKDFSAQIEESSGEVLVQVPNKGAVRYSIRSVHEKD